MESNGGKGKPLSANRRQPVSIWRVGFKRAISRKGGFWASCSEKSSDLLDDYQLGCADAVRPKFFIFFLIIKVQEMMAK